MSDVIDPMRNDVKTFLVAPCGSKEGWPPDVKHTDHIKAMIQYLESLKYDDGSTAVKYVYVTFGDLGLTIEDYMGHDVYEEETDGRL